MAFLLLRMQSNSVILNGDLYLSFCHGKGNAAPVCPAMLHNVGHSLLNAET
ncbi:hypothetical protein D3C74_468300 [compost metagenome]